MNEGQTMDFAVLHHIHDPAGWANALDGEHSWPSDFDLRAFVEANDRHLAICVWNAPGPDQLQQSLDANFGQVAVNEVIPAQVHKILGSGQDS